MLIRPVFRTAARTVVAMAFCCTIAAALPALGYTISGTVRAAVGGQPVGGVELQLWSYDPGTGSWTRPGVYDESNADGTYSLDFYDAGIYGVQAYNSTEYAEQWWLGAASQSGASTITVPGDPVTGIDFALISTAAAKRDSTLSLKAPATPSYKSAKLEGYLNEPGEGGLMGRTVAIEYKASGGWTNLGYCLTNNTGYYSYAAKPATKTLYRAVFLEELTHHGSVSSTVTVTPHVRLTRTTSWTTLGVNRTYYSKGYIEPRHYSTDGKLVVKAYKRRSNGTYAALSTTPTKTFSVSSKYIYDSTTRTKYQIPVKLTSRGYWKLVVYHKADSKNAATYGSADYVRVK